MARNIKKNYTVVTMAAKPIQPEQEKVLVSWIAPSRPFKRRNREFYITLLSIVGLIGAILFIIEGLMPAVLLAALFFLFYILSTVEPEKIEYQITTWGVRFAGKLTEWSNMGRFWFTDRLGSSLLILETYSIPGRVELVIDKDSSKKAIEDTLKKYLIHEEVPPNVLDKAANWASKKLPQS